MRMEMILTVALVLAATTASAAEVYKWTDESGTVHFSAQPPEGSEAEQVKVRKGPTLPAAPEVVDDGADAAKAASCEMARKNLETLRNNPTVELQEADGSRRTLSTEERGTMQAAEENRVKMFCDSDGDTP